MLCVLGQKLLLQSLDTFGVALTVEIGPLFHGGKGSPALGVYDVRILEGVRHIVGDAEGAAGFFCILPCDFLHLGHNLVALGMGQHHVHAHAGHKSHHALGNGEGFAVGGRVGPGHGQLLSLQILNAAEFMDDVKHIGHALGGMVDVALEVDQGGLLLQDAVLIALGHGVHHLVHIGIALANVHVIPDADDVGHEGNHVGSLADGLPVCYLGLALIQVLYLQAKEIAGGGKGKAGAGGIVAEEGDSQPTLKYLGGNVVLPHIAEGVCQGPHGHELIIGFLPGEEEISLVHLFKIQGVQLINIIL